MNAIRCPECGDVRWSFLGLTKEPGECEICGAQMVAERRRPLTATSRAQREERRDVTDAVAGPAA